MSKTITISNTGAKTYELQYRMPGEVSQVLKVFIYPYALNKEYSFPSEAYYLEFKKQNEAFFAGDSPSLVEGKVTVAKIEKINKVVADVAQEKIEGEVEKITNQISDISEQSAGKRVTFDLEKVAKNQSKGKRK